MGKWQVPQTSLIPSLQILPQSPLPIVRPVSYTVGPFIL